MEFSLISLLEIFSKFYSSIKINYSFLYTVSDLNQFLRDKILICLTQTKKFGSVLRIDREIFQASENQENVFNIR